MRPLPIFLLFAAVALSLNCGKSPETSVIESESSGDRESVTTIYSMPRVLPTPSPAATSEAEEEGAYVPPKRRKRLYPPPVPAEPSPAPHGLPDPPIYRTPSYPRGPLPHPPFKVEKVGLPGCDFFATKYLQCIKLRVPRNRDALLFQDLQYDIGRWQEMSKTEAGSLKAEKECKAALAGAKKRMQPYRCYWQ